MWVCVGFIYFFINILKLAVSTGIMENRELLYNTTENTFLYFYILFIDFISNCIVYVLISFSF